MGHWEIVLHAYLFRKVFTILFRHTIVNWSGLIPDFLKPLANYFSSSSGSVKITVTFLPIQSFGTITLPEFPEALTFLFSTWAYAFSIAKLYFITSYNVAYIVLNILYAYNVVYKVSDKENYDD